MGQQGSAQMAFTYPDDGLIDVGSLLSQLPPASLSDGKTNEEHFKGTTVVNAKEEHYDVINGWDDNKNGTCESQGGRKTRVH